MLTTLKKAKTFMSIPEDDNTEDLSILTALKAASLAIERECNRSFGLATYRQTLDGSGTKFLRLRNFPIRSVSSLVISGEEQELDSFTIEPENGMLFRRSGWPCGTRTIEVEYSAGYVLPDGEAGAETATLPENIELACIMYAQMLLRAPGVKSERVGDLSVTYQDNGMPDVIQSLIRL